MLQSRFEQTFTGHVADKGSEFMRFWKTVNDILKSRDLPEMLYGEAKDWHNEHRYFTDDHGFKVTASGSVECPHCRFGFAPSAFGQHMREKHADKHVHNWCQTSNDLIDRCSVCGEERA